jgi:hypothetical protein
MHRLTRSVATLTAATALFAAAAPAGAQASTTTIAQAKVGAHLQEAQRAARQVTRLTRRGDSAGAGKALRTARREATTAARGARALARTAADDPAAATTAVWSLAATAGTYGAAMQRFSSLIPTADDPALQSLLAGALPGTIAGRGQLITELTTLVGELTGQAQTIAAQVLAALQAAAPGQVQEVAQAAAAPDLPGTIAALVQQALAAATTTLQTGLPTLAAVVPALPSGAQAQITQVLGLLTTTMQELMPLLQQVLGVATTAATGGMKQATGLVQGLLGPQGLVGSLLGGLLGGGTGTVTPASGGGGTATPAAGLGPFAGARPRAPRARRAVPRTGR